MVWIDDRPDGNYGRYRPEHTTFDLNLNWRFNSAVSLYYYIRIVKTMYFEEPVDTTVLVSGAGARATLAANGALVLLLGVLPSPLMLACLQAVKQALAT